MKSCRTRPLPLAPRSVPPPPDRASTWVCPRHIAGDTAPSLARPGVPIQYHPRRGVNPSRDFPRPCPSVPSLGRLLIAELLRAYGRHPVRTPSVTLPAAERHDELIDAALYKLVGGARVGAAGKRWERARRQARLPVKMGGMGLTSAVDIREPAWIGTCGPSSPGRCASCTLLSATLT